MNPRPLTIIRDEYNRICKADELLIEEMEMYRPQDTPKKIIKKRLEFAKKLRELDEERYTSVAFWYNCYRIHYAQTYPSVINHSLIKQALTASQYKNPSA